MSMPPGAMLSGLNHFDADFFFSVVFFGFAFRGFVESSRGVSLSSNCATSCLGANKR